MKKDLRTLKATTKRKGTKLIAIASTEDTDRAGDILPVSKWNLKQFEMNPVLQAGHDYRPQYTVGIAKNMQVVGKQLTFEPVFHEITPLAKQIKQMYEKGFLKAWSVGFIPAQDAKGLNELLEVSAVAVPANAYALMKGFDGETMEKELQTKLQEWKEKAVYEEDETDENWNSEELSEEGEESLETEEEEDEEEEAEVSSEILETPEEVVEVKDTPLDEPNAGEDLTAGVPLDVATQHVSMLKSETMDILSQLVANLTTACDPTTDDNGEMKGTMNMIPPQLLRQHYNDAKSGINDAFNAHGNDMLGSDDASSGSDNLVNAGMVYKKSWNPDLPKVFSKDFDTNSVRSGATSFENGIFMKYFDCQVKDLFNNQYFIESPLIGAYLAGFKSELSKYQVSDTRNWYGQAEYPPVYEVIQLSSSVSDDFLLEGTNFYRDDGKNVMAVKFQPVWGGMIVSLVTTLEQKTLNKLILSNVEKWVLDNNPLKGEKFSLSGQFIKKNDYTFDDVFMTQENVDSVKKSLRVLSGDLKSRGLLMMGPPGTGKTMTGKVLTQQENSTFIWVSAKDMYRIGAIGAIKLAFQLARDLGPSILFFEDIDAWIKGEATDLLKTELDGVLENKGLLTILTSNFPEQLPDALLDRPGRFHDILNYALPTEDIRSKMIQKWGNVDEATAKPFAEQTEGYSGAHIKELVEYSRIVAEDDGLPMSEALVKGIEKLNQQKELVQAIRQTTKGFDMISVKEGKVLSAKNLQHLTTAKEHLDTVLKSVVPNSEPSDDITEPVAPEIVVDPAKDNQTIVHPKTYKAPSADEIVLKALQKIAGHSNSAIREIKKGRE